MGVKENAKEHFKSRFDGALAVYHVDEWDTDIYYRSVISGKKQAEIMKKIDAGNTVEAVCMALIVRALDEDGKPIWRPAELAELMRSYDTTIIGRIVENIAEDDPSIDDLKKP